MAKVGKVNLKTGKVEYVDEDLEVFEIPLSKNQLLSSITVETTSGKVFDGHAEARSNMMSAIMAAEIVGQFESGWKLADNTVASITLDELKEALSLSIQAAGQIYLNS